MDQGLCTVPLSETELLDTLEQRLGRSHVRKRLGLEQEYEEKFAHGINFRHPDKWYSLESFFTIGLKLTGLYWRGIRNAERVTLCHNHAAFPDLPAAFDGFTILQISDPHVDMNPGAMHRLAELLGNLEYDICVLTGDFRGKAFGPFDAALVGMAEICAELKNPVYGILGNHDTVRMLPHLESMGIRMLMNESERIVRGNQRIHLAGVDDHHYYRAADIEKAASSIADNEFSILLSHTPENYKAAAEAGFRLFLSGHTHGGQVCLTGKIPLSLSADLPRRLGVGPWRYHTMTGYTSAGVGSSLVPVRFNCPPEITLHRLSRI